MGRCKNLGKRLTFHIFRARRDDIAVIDFRIKEFVAAESHLDRKCGAIMHIPDLGARGRRKEYCEPFTHDLIISAQIRKRALFR